MRTRRFMLMVCGLLLAASHPPAEAQELFDSGLIAEPLVTSNRKFTSLTFIAPDRFLLTEKDSGAVRIYQNGAFQQEALLTFPVPLDTSQDGLLGMVKDPHFDTNGYIYFYYTRAGTEGDDNIDRLTRFTWTGDGFDQSSEFVLRELIGTPNIHHGGVMVIGADEKLYLVTGDRGRSEQTTNHASGGPNEIAVILRLNLDGTAPDDNPFQEPGWEYIYGYGVRNSFGLAIDPLTGNVWNTENGTGAGFEELNLYPPGANGGWNKVIGFADPSPSELFLLPGAFYVNPALQYHGVPTSLVFQPSPVLGAANWNRMFLGFFIGPVADRDSIWRLTLNEDRDCVVLTTPELQDAVVNLPDPVDEIIFARQLSRVTDLKIGPDGFLYVLRHASPSVYRIRPNHPTCDANTDGDLDLGDFMLMQSCFSGSTPTEPLPAFCSETADVDVNGAIDAVDHNAFTTTFSGPLRLR